MEDNITSGDSFAPSIFAQAKELQAEMGITPEGVSPVEKKYEIEIEEETAQILVQIPFDAAASLTKVNDVALREQEYIKLGKLWRKPLQRILSQYENSDIAIAALATLGIASEKYLEYKLEIDRRNSTGNER